MCDRRRRVFARELGRLDTLPGGAMTRAADSILPRVPHGFTTVRRGSADVPGYGSRTSAEFCSSRRRSERITQ